MSSAVTSMIEHANRRPTVKAFCVGQAKSGTASLYGLLATKYGAAHEPERAQILDMILRESRGEVDTGLLFPGDLWNR